MKRVFNKLLQGGAGGDLPRVLAASLYVAHRPACRCPLASGGPIRETVPTGGTRCELIAWAAQLEESSIRGERLSLLGHSNCDDANAKALVVVSSGMSRIGAG